MTEAEIRWAIQDLKAVDDPDGRYSEVVRHADELLALMATPGQHAAVQAIEPERITSAPVITGQLPTLSNTKR